MCRRFLLLGTIALLLMANYRAPVRQGKGGSWDGLIREKLGELGAQGKWIESSLRERLLGKRVHYMKREHSWSGKVIAINVQPITESNDSSRAVRVTVETVAGMGDMLEESKDKEFPNQDDYSSQSTIALDQISGIIKEAHPYVGRTIKVSYDDIWPADLPNNPSEMFARGYPNIIVAAYSDGYVEVDVKGYAGKLPDGSPVTSSGTVFIHMDDILHDTNLQIVSSLDLE